MTAVTKYYTNDMTRREWLDYRANGIGGSDIAKILGVSKYGSAAQLFAEKIGLYPVVDEDNLAMFMGRFLEDQVADLWQYWEGDIDSMMDNHRRGRKVNQCHKVNAYLSNPKYPHLLGSIDRRITHVREQRRIGVLECKTINGWYADSWEAGIPPDYVFQLQQYLMITEYTYGEAAMLIDGRELKVFQFEADHELQDRILSASVEFWEAVLTARPLAEKLLALEMDYDQNRTEIEDLEGRIRELEPAPDNSKAYEDYMKKRFPSPDGIREGKPEELSIVLDYEQVRASIKLQEERHQQLKNQIIEFVRNQEEVTFGPMGKVTYKTNKRGVKALNVRIASS